MHNLNHNLYNAMIPDHVIDTATDEAMDFIQEEVSLTWSQANRVARAIEKVAKEIGLVGYTTARDVAISRGASDDLWSANYKSPAPF